MIDSQTLGRLGEESAALYLTRHGYRVLHRGLRLGRAEIDIVAENEEYLVFVEVKTRRQLSGRSSPFGVPSEAVDERKRAMLISGAERYIAENVTDKLVRIDVIEVYADPYSDVYRVLDIRHLENAVRRIGKFSRRVNRGG